MSIRCSTAVWNYSKAEGTNRLVLLALADRADDQGYCWPGVQYLAKKCRVSERTVQRCLKELKDLGELEVHVGKGAQCLGGHTNRYRVKTFTCHPDATVDTPRSDSLGDKEVSQGTPLVVTAPSPNTSDESSVDPSELTIITTPDGPSGHICSDISPFNSPEGKATASDPVVTQSEDLCDQFCHSVHKLRQLWNERPIPPLSKEQCDKIRQLFGEVKYYSLKKILWIYIASWSHWESVRGDLKKNKFVEGFHAKFFWPPEQGLKHLGKIEDFLMDEATMDKAWANDLMKEVRKAVSATPTLTPEEPKVSDEYRRSLWRLL